MFTMHYFNIRQKSTVKTYNQGATLSLLNKMTFEDVKAAVVRIQFWHCKGM